MELAGAAEVDAAVEQNLTLTAYRDVPYVVDATTPQIQAPLPDSGKSLPTAIPSQIRPALGTNGVTQSVV